MWRESKCVPQLHSPTQVTMLARFHALYNRTGTPFDENVANLVRRGDQQDELVVRAIALRLESEILRRDIRTYLDRMPA